MEKFSHIDEKGTVRMVDVTDKNVSNRTARAEGQIGLLPDTIAAITDNALPKGNV
jgi:cyclic pyranopterin phosphate synthase